MTDQLAAAWQDVIGDPMWVVILKAVLIFAILVVYTLFNIWFERRVVARMQHRIGPNMNGPFGLLQSLADGVKLGLKEEIFPKAADKVVYYIAPLLAVIPAFMAWAIIPFGPEVKIPFTDTYTTLQLTDMPVAILYVLAVTAIGIYGIVLAGWSSGSIYALLGGLRSSAQMISYDVAMGLAIVPVFIYAGSMSASEIVAAQEGMWFVVLFPSFVIYVIAMVGETNRAPFDLPEAEGELVGGFHTEYSSFKFAMFFLAEYINMVTVSALATTLFLGGWRAPFFIDQVWAGANEGYWPVLWFLGKTLCFIFMFVWLRGSLPRMRYDQFMHFGWKVLIPVALGWVVIVAFMRKAQMEGLITTNVLLIGAAVAGVLLLASMFIPAKSADDETDAHADPETAAPSPEDVAWAGGYPVPPMSDPSTIRSSNPSKGGQS